MTSANAASAARTASEPCQARRDKRASRAIQYNNAGAFGGRAPSGNGTSVVTTTGTQTSGRCVQIDANGNHIAAAAACGWLPLSELCIALDQARCLSRAAAAHYCGVSKSGFDEWVRRGIVPGPGTQRWDRKAIDLALDRASGIETIKDRTLFDEWKARHAG